MCPSKLFWEETVSQWLEPGNLMLLQVGLGLASEGLVLWAQTSHGKLEEVCNLHVRTLHIAHVHVHHCLSFSEISLYSTLVYSSISLNHFC